MVEATQAINSSMSRSEIQDALLKIAQQHIDNYENLEVVLEDKERNYEARQVWTDDGPLTLIKHRADGFTEEHFNKWKSDMVGA